MQKSSATISRRELLAGSITALAGLGLRASSRPPNVLFLIADNLGWRDLGCLGDKNLQTPALDGLAHEGVTFKSAFFSASSCSPSRASLISGQAPHSVNVLGLTHLYPWYQMPLSIPTLPRLFKSAGYRTAINGKWHVSPYVPVSH